MNICLMGCSGLIGSAVAQYYSGDKRTTFAGFSRSKSNVPTNICDFCDDNASDYIIRECRDRFLDERVDLLILNAWQGTPRTSMGANRRPIYRANCVIINTYQSVIRTIKPRQCIFISSAGGLYPQISNVPALEIFPIKTQTEYAAQKLAAERVLIDECTGARSCLAVLRVSTCFGICHKPFGQGIINEWLHLHHQHRPLPVFNTFDSKINLIYIDDLVRAIKIISQKGLEGVFNIGAVESVTIEEIINGIELTSGRRPDLALIDLPQKRSMLINTDKFFREANVRFRTDLKSRILSMHQTLQDRYEPRSHYPPSK